MTELINYLIIGAANGFIYSMIAVGFILIFKCSKIFNLAQPEMTVLGAYLVYAATVQLKLSFFLAIIITVGIALVLGLMIERMLLRPLIGHHILSILILTLGLGGFIRGCIILIWGPDMVNVPPFFPKGGVHLGKLVTLGYPHIFFFLVGSSLILLLGIYYHYSRRGLAMRATADDTVMAKILGIKVTQVWAISWAIASMVGALSGVLLTSITSIHYSTVEVGFKAMTVALVGGMESLAGVILIGPFLGIIETVVAGYLDPLVGGGISEVAPFLVLLIVLIFKPHGIFGWEIIERV